MESVDWKSQLAPAIRQKIVDHLAEAIKTGLPCLGPMDLRRVQELAVGCEQNVLKASTSQEDYYRRIRMRLCTVKLSKNNIASDSLVTSTVCIGENPGFQGNQSIGRQQQLTQSNQNSFTSSKGEAMATVPSSMVPANSTYSFPSIAKRQVSSLQKPLGSLQEKETAVKNVMPSRLGRQVQGEQNGKMFGKNQNQFLKIRENGHGLQIDPSLKQPTLESIRHCPQQTHMQEQIHEQHLLQQQQFLQATHMLSSKKPLMQTPGLRSRGFQSAPNSGIEHVQNCSPQLSTESGLKPQAGFVGLYSMPHQSPGTSPQNIGVLNQRILPPYQQLLDQRQINATGRQLNQPVGRHVPNTHKKQWPNQSNPHLIHQTHELTSKGQLGPAQMQVQQPLHHTTISAPLGSASFTEKGNLVEQKEVCKKVDSMKLFYLPKLVLLRKIIDDKILQCLTCESLPLPKRELLHKLKSITEYHISSLQMSEDKILCTTMAKLNAWEERMVVLLEKFKKPDSSVKQGELPMHGINILKHTVQSKPDSLKVPLPSRQSNAKLQLKVGKQVMPTVQLEHKNAHYHSPKLQQHESMQSQISDILNELDISEVMQDLGAQPQSQLKSQELIDYNRQMETVQIASHISENSNLHNDHDNVPKTEKSSVTPTRPHCLPSPSIADAPNGSSQSCSVGGRPLEHLVKLEHRVAPTMTLENEAPLCHVQMVQEPEHMQLQPSDEFDSKTLQATADQSQKQPFDEFDSKTLQAIADQSQKPSKSEELIHHNGKLERLQTESSHMSENSILQDDHNAASNNEKNSGTLTRSPSAFHCPSISDASERSSKSCSDAGKPIQRLIKMVSSLSREALVAAVADMSSVIHLTDAVPGTSVANVPPLVTSRLRVTSFPEQYDTSRSSGTKRYYTYTSPNSTPISDSMDVECEKPWDMERFDAESASAPHIKRPRIETRCALLEEMREINQQLINTVLVISDENADNTGATAETGCGEGTIVVCSFDPVSVRSNMKPHYATTHMSLSILALRLFIPSDYPNCSPVILGMLPPESNNNEEISARAMSKLDRALRSLEDPFSLREVACSWDVCARSVITEYAEQRGGGNFSSKYGTWTNCLTNA